MIDEYEREITVDELYAHTLNIMFEKPNSKDYDAYYIGNINLLLGECFDVNNSLRIQHGKEALEFIPFVTNGSDVIPYEYHLTREVLPVGLAAKFFIDDDLQKYGIFDTLYKNLKNRYERTIPKDVEEYYG